MIFGAPCPSAPPRVRNGRGPGEGCGSARKTGQTGQTGQKDRQPPLPPGAPPPKVLEPPSPRRPWAPWGSSGLLFSNINRGADDVQNRTAAQDVLQITRVPTRDPTGADFAGVPRKRFWLQRCAFLATGSERVPTGADCATPTTAQPHPHPLSGRSDRCCASEIVIFQSQPIFRTCLN